MPFDAGSYLRIDAPQCVGTSAGGASFTTSTGDILEVSCFGPGVFRMRIGPQTRADYGLLIGRSKACEVTQDGATRRLQTGEAVLETGSAPLSMRLVHAGTTLLTSITDESMQGVTRLPAFGRIRQGGRWTASFALASGEPVYGLGEKHGPLNKRGQLLHSWVQDAQGVNTGLAHHEVPFAWSANAKGAWGVFVHTPGAVIHGVGHPDWSHRAYALVVDDEALDLFFFAAATPAALLQQFADLTGHASEVPRWSLGLGVARMSWSSPRDAASTVARLRERKMPCDFVSLDHAALWSPEQRFDFEWDASRIGDVAQAIADIGQHQAKVCVWESPYVSVQSRLYEALGTSGYLLRSGYGTPYVFSGSFLPPLNVGGSLVRGPDSALVDFTSAAAYGWWRDAHSALFAAGIEAIHCDGGEHVPEDAIAGDADHGVRLHNVYPVLYGRCVQEASEKFGAASDTPPLVFTRAGWTGSQRASVHVAADAQLDWEGVAASIRGALSLGMSGVPLHCACAPGTYGTNAPDAELCMRALQASMFASHVMIRASAAWEPWAFSVDVEAIARKWAGFRYRLVPYLEVAIRQAVRSGIPVMRAMALAFPGNMLVRAFETQFMCGDALLVAPVLQPGGEVEIALPPGAWFDINSRQRLPGHRVIRYRASLDQFPVFGREGHVLPLGPAAQHTGELDASAPLNELWVFGKPGHPFGEYTQARRAVRPEHAGEIALEVARNVKVERFGDAADCQILPLPA